MRCANSESLAKYEREVDAKERIHDEKVSAGALELDEYIDAINEILERYEILELKEYVEDRI